MASVHFPRGTTYALTIKLALSDGSERLLEEGEVLRFGLKRSLEDAECLISKDMTADDYDGDKHRYVITLDPSDTEGLGLGVYYYDIGLQRGEDDYIPIVKTDTLELLSNVTARSTS